MLNKIAKAVEDCELDMIAAYVLAAKGQGHTAKEILNEGLVKGMDVVGKEFSKGTLFLPEVLMAANTMQTGVDLIKDELAASGDNESKGKIVIGTVHGDLHDIGKKIVGMMLEGAGYEVIDLGVDVTSDAFIAKAKEVDPDFIGMSAMLTTTMKEMEGVVAKLKSEGLRAVPLVGGAPLTAEYANSFGANYTHDAQSAVEFVKSI